MTTTPRVRDDIDVVELDGEAVVYDPRTGQLHHLNGPATIVLGLLDGSSPLEAIANDIADAFHVDPGHIEQDISDALHLLGDAGLLAELDAAQS